MIGFRAILPLLALGLLPAPLVAQRETESERQTREDQQATRDRIDQTARIEKMHRDNAADYERAKQAAALQRNRPDGLLNRTFSQRWTVNDWQIWAEPGSVCEAIEQSWQAPFNFWGFRQRPGEHLELLFSSDGPARPQRVRMLFNDGGDNFASATVERLDDRDAYVIPLRAELYDFPANTEFKVDAGDRRILFEQYHAMDKIESLMTKCSDWQDEH